LGSVNDTVLALVVHLAVPTVTVTHQFVPLGNPLSVKASEYCPGGIAVNEMARVIFFPLTTTIPEVGLAVYPDTAPTVNAYPVVLFSRLLNVMVEVARMCPASR